MIFEKWKYGINILFKYKGRYSNKDFPGIQKS